MFEGELSRSVSRRLLLRGTLAAAAVGLVTACTGTSQPAAPAAKPTEAPKPPASPAASGQPTSAPAAGAAPGKATAPDKEITLSYWTLFTGGDKEFMDAMVEAFQKEYPKLKLETETGKWENYYDHLTTSMAGGRAPDISIMHVNNIPGYAAKGTLYDIDKEVTDAGFTAEQFLEVPWKGAVYNGKRYAVPLDVHPLIFFYNKEVLKQAGVMTGDTYTLPKTREEFVQHADAVKKIGKTGYGLATGGKAGTYREWFSALYQNGGTLLSTDNKKATFNSDAGVEALQWFVDIINKYKYIEPGVTSDTSLAMFQQGQTGMENYGVWRTGAYDKALGDKLGTAPLLQFFNKKPAIWANSHTFVFPTQRQKDPEKLKAGMFFVQWMTDHGAMWAKAGHIPAKKAVIDSAEYKALPHRSEFAKNLDQIQYAPFIVPLAEVENTVQDEIQAAIQQKKTSKQALDDAAKKVDEILARG